MIRVLVLFNRHRKQRALEGVVNEVKVEVAAIKQRGEIGEQERLTEQRQQKAKLLADAQIAENKQAQLTALSDMELKVAKAGYEQKHKIADIESKAAAELRQQELQMQVCSLEKQTAAVLLFMFCLLCQKGGETAYFARSGTTTCDRLVNGHCQGSKRCETSRR